jgi:hypothetical protein
MWFVTIAELEPVDVFHHATLPFQKADSGSGFVGVFSGQASRPSANPGSGFPFPSAGRSGRGAKVGQAPGVLFAVEGAGWVGGQGSMGVAGAPAPFPAALCCGPSGPSAQSGRYRTSAFAHT